MRWRFGLAIVAAIALVIGLLFWRWPRPDPATGTAAVAPDVGHAVEEVAGEQAAPVAEAPAAAAPLPFALARSERDPESGNGRLEGFVVSRGSGHGIAGAELTFLHQAATHSVTSQRDGRFRFDPPEPGGYEVVEVVADGFLPFAPQWGQSPLQFVARSGVRIRDVVVHLTPTVEYRGTVIDPQERPVAGAAVQVRIGRPRDDALAEVFPPTTSDAEGRFRIAAPDGALVEASHPDFTPGRARIDFAAQVSHRVVVKLRPAADAGAASGFIAGRVLLGDRPLEGALVTAYYVDKVGLTGPDLSLALSAISDQGGRFVVDHLDPGRHYVEATYPGLFPAAAPNVATGTGDLVLRLATGASLTGTVTDAGDAAPVAAFTVLWAPEFGSLRSGPERAQAVFDGDGRYEVRGLAAGPYSVRVAARGFATSPRRSVTVQAMADQPAVADFALERGSRVFGQVVDERSRQPIAGARVTVEDRPSAEASVQPTGTSTLTGADGRFELRGLATGPQSLLAAASGHHGRLFSGLRVGAGDEIGPLTIELAPLDEGEEPQLELTGIGAQLALRDGVFVIARVLAGGGAEEAGLVPGDRIVAIEGRPAGEFQFIEAIETIRGPENSSVALTVQKAAGNATVEIRVYRRRIRS
ncbi:MAG: carboxypeptidase regulatory-like domain-containing protein [Deltaproteobacteria bacterium]|nr:carboxypeptidase regulatory-like domain-containing protein [Deltaproteobacteria bacterium]